MNAECFMKWLEILLEPAVLIILGAAGFWWGHRYWRKQKHEELEYLKQQQKIEFAAGFDQKRFDARLEACKAVWGLILYFSENDNDKNVLRRGELDEDGNKIIYFRKNQAKLFFEKIPELFYEKGHGLLLPNEIKSRLYTLRGHLMGLYFNAEKAGKEEIAIQNKELLNSIIQIREGLQEKLKEIISENSFE